MTNKIIDISGKIRRIFVETSDVTTYVRFTLVGDTNIYNLETRERDIRQNLELTAPDDDVSLSYEVQNGIFFKENVLLKFQNATLKNEVNS